MTKDEALKLALEALEVCEQSNYGRNWVWPDTAHPTAMANVKESITAIKEALAQPEQEPVAYVKVLPMGHNQENRHFADGLEHLPPGTPLYTTPPQRKPLTDEEISSLWDGHTVPVFGEIGINPIVFARAIEAAHGIKGEA